MHRVTRKTNVIQGILARRPEFFRLLDPWRWSLACLTLTLASCSGKHSLPTEATEQAADAQAIETGGTDPGTRQRSTRPKAADTRAERMKLAEQLQQEQKFDSAAAVYRECLLA